jgi:stage V sporulation protein S
VQAIGAGAVNQTVKAIGIARGYVAPAGINLITIPAFLDIEVNGEERTAIRFIIEPR